MESSSDQLQERRTSDELRQDLLALGIDPDKRDNPPLKRGLGGPSDVPYEHVHEAKDYGFLIQIEKMRTAKLERAVDEEGLSGPERQARLRKIRQTQRRRVLNLHQERMRLRSAVGTVLFKPPVHARQGRPRVRRVRPRGRVRRRQQSRDGPGLADPEPGPQQGRQRAEPRPLGAVLADTLQQNPAPEARAIGDALRTQMRDPALRQRALAELFSLLAALPGRGVEPAQITRLIAEIQVPDHETLGQLALDL